MKTLKIRKVNIMKKNRKYTAIFMALLLSGAISGCGENEAENNIQNETLSEAVSEDAAQSGENETPPSVSEKSSLPSPSEELSEKLDKISIAAERYYSKSKSSKEFFSWAGFLAYYDENHSPVDVNISTLKSDGYLKSDSEIENAIILYLNPKDIDPLAKKTSLDIFAACETTEGFKIAGVGYDEKTIPSEDFKKILLKYNIDNGAISNPETNEATYNALMVGIGMFREDMKAEESRVPEYIVRYAANNDLYAIVILSGTDDVTDITQYLLIKNGDGWNVIESGLENQENIKAFLNSKYTNFDLNLLPPYTLYIYRKEVRTTEHYEPIINMLKRQNIIGSSDKITYCCGTQHVLYMELSSGKKIAGGAKKDGSFSCDYVETYEDAIRKLGQFVDPVPAFILKYNH